MASELLQFAVALATRAGASALTHYQQNVNIDVKPDASPVTAADYAAERMIRQEITSRYPGDGIVGEEFGIEREHAARRWIIDPIDGTRTFMHGVPLFGCLIALEVDGEAELGVIHFPALQESVYAARGEGCWWNGRKAAVSATARLDQALVLTTDVANISRYGMENGWRRLVEGAAMMRTWGDCYGHALVATGRAEVMIDPVMSIWDAAALKPIVEEAGGVFTDCRGNATHNGGSAVSSNQRLANEVRRILEERE